MSELLARGLFLPGATPRRPNELLLCGRSPPGSFWYFAGILLVFRRKLERLGSPNSSSSLSSSYSYCSSTSYPSSTLPGFRILLALEANEVNGGLLGGDDKPEPGLGGGVPVRRGPGLEEDGGV